MDDVDLTPTAPCEVGHRGGTAPSVHRVTTVNVPFGQLRTACGLRIVSIFPMRHSRRPACRTCFPEGKS